MMLVAEARRDVLSIYFYLCIILKEHNILKYYL